MPWRLPEPIKLEQQRPPRAPKRPSFWGRTLAGLTGVALGVGAAIGIWHTFRDGPNQASPLGPVALLMPTALMLRYALTGHAKLG
ncbi:MAG: hypothetical protein EXR75_11140 [Myxococcales bacterium]|nr:hypothetical protein [Myxococcales bacterium]